MKLDDRICELIAVGTSVGANCHSCLEYHVRKARERGIPNDEIGQAIGIGKLVRRGAQGNIDKLAVHLSRGAEGSVVGTSAGCGCNE